MLPRLVEEKQSGWGDKFVIVEGLLFLTVPHPRRKKRIGDLLLWRETSSRTSANVFSLSLS
jgi:hypothetical protein